MNKTKSRNIVVLSVIILFSFLFLSVGYSSINKSKAQELNNKNQKVKSLRELAQERDIEVSIPNSESNWERGLDSISQSAEVIIVGKISDIATSFAGDNWLRTDYTVDVQQVLQPFTSQLPIEAYASPPIPFGNSIKISRSGGSMIVDGHRVTQKNPGQEDLIEGKTFIFFLHWSPAYEAYIPVGGISGVVLVGDNLKIKPLASESKSQDANLKYKDSELNIFIEQVLKEKTSVKKKSKFLTPSENSGSSYDIMRSIDPDPYPEPTPGQTACSSAASNCLASTSTRGRLTGPITYSFNEQSLQLLPADQQQDFRARIAAAAANWSQSTGVSITLAPSGQTGNLTVGIDNTPEGKLANGYVDGVPNSPNRSVMNFSGEWTGWSADGKDRIASHEIGHLLGLPDVNPTDCPGVETIMRKLGGSGGNEEARANLQLENGYGCAYSGGLCADEFKLPQPPRPNSCDIKTAKDRNPPPTPTPTATPTPSGGGYGGGLTYCEMYPSACYGGGGPSGGGGGGYTCFNNYEERTYESCITIDGTTSCSTETRYVVVSQSCYLN